MISWPLNVKGTTCSHFAAGSACNRFVSASWCRSYVSTISATVELALIEQFIRGRGVDPAKLHELPHDERVQLQKEAAAHTALKLAEMESRAHYVHEIHGDH